MASDLIVYVTTDGAPISGGTWPRGTRLNVPAKDAQAAIANGIASFTVLDDTPPEVSADDTNESEPVKRRGRPPKDA